MTRLTVGRDEHSSLTYSRKLSDKVKRVTLTALGSASFVIPADVRTLLLSYSPGSNVVVGQNVVPTQPTGSFTDEPFTDLLPVALQVQPGETINFLEVGNDPAIVWVQLLKV